MQRVSMVCYSSRSIQEDTGNYISISQFVQEKHKNDKPENKEIGNLQGVGKKRVGRSREYKQDSRDEKGTTLF